MGRYGSWGTGGKSSGLKTLRVLRNTEIHNCVHKRTSLDRIQNQSTLLNTIYFISTLILSCHVTLDIKSDLFRFSCCVSASIPLHPACSTDLRTISLEPDRCAALALTSVTFCLDLIEVYVCVCA
jgi:hypothetical protein